MAKVARRRGSTPWWRKVGALWTPALRARLGGAVLAAIGGTLAAMLATYRAGDPSLDTAAPGRAGNVLGPVGADLADISVQTLGLGAAAIALILIIAGLSRLVEGPPPRARAHRRARILTGVLAVLTLTGALAAANPPARWPLATGLGGTMGDSLLRLLSGPLMLLDLAAPTLIAAVVLGLISLTAMAFTLTLGRTPAARPVAPPRRGPEPAPPLAPPGARRRAAGHQGPQGAAPSFGTGDARDSAHFAVH